MNRFLISSRISHLFKLCSPTAIGRFIISVVVDPINGMFGRWLCAHVLKKVFKLHPSFTNGYSSASVILKVLLFHIPASLYHACPSSVLRGIRFSMRNVLRSGYVQIPTATRLSVSLSERIIRYFELSPAFTNAKATKSYASRRECFWRSLGNYFKLSVGVSDDGYFRRHNFVDSKVVLVAGVRLITGTRHDYYEHGRLKVNLAYV